MRQNLCRRAVLGAATLLVLIGGASPATAVCALCTASVRLDDTLAECFVERADDAAARLKAEGLGFVVVDLGDCRARSTLPTADAPSAADLDSRFIADGPTLDCLSTAIAEHAGALDPGTLFDLTRIC